jgi:hypothetical protein
MNCHSQIWTDAALLEPVRHSWATGESIVWTKVHDLPDFVYFNHEIHVNKGIGCETCHGRVDEMPIMYEENTLQMEWCLNCHRNPVENLRPTSEIYNMDWKKPSDLNPVWCAATDVKRGTPTSESVSCTTTDPTQSGNPQIAALRLIPAINAQAASAQASDASGGLLSPPSLTYTKFTSQEALGGFLFQHYNIRPARELSNCETCHR